LKPARLGHFTAAVEYFGEMADGASERMVSGNGAVAEGKWCGGGNGGDGGGSG
jgi:hypothetical protein